MRYPPIDPYDHGMLAVGDGQEVYWETCGNPDGKPAVVLHGGPGSGCQPGARQLFDPAAYRIVLFDQRGAGRSVPHASEPSVDLSVNTTEHLIADLELLREHLGIERWLVRGVSWGSTLALAYAERHPERVSEAVLVAVALTRPSDVRWSRGLRRFLPAEWSRFRDGGLAGEGDGDLVAAYARLPADPDPEVQARAARDWCAWEDAITTLEPGGAPNPRYGDARFRLGFARLVTHYFAHAAWLDEDQLLADAHRLADVPGVLIHGRLDLGASLSAAWDLTRAWPGSELVVVGGAGHASSELNDHVVAVTDRFAQLR